MSGLDLLGNKTKQVHKFIQMLQITAHRVEISRKKIVEQGNNKRLLS